MNNKNTKREAGILLPVTSLPSEYGIGCFSKEAYDFVDWLSAAGQKYWQILPLGPTGFGDSPYQSFSTFAGNPYMISLCSLIDEGVLTKEECDDVDFGENEEYINYKKIYEGRYCLLKKAYERSKKDANLKEFEAKNKDWLEDYALFMAVKESFGGKPWYEWTSDIRLRTVTALETYREKLLYEIEFWKYVQYKFYSQWSRLKCYANSKGISVIGDIPIYVAADSADVWANPELFQLDEDRVPTYVAGCPPDGFSKTGQLWGNPLYAWERHKKDGYTWWIERLRHSFELYDLLRIDHFRGFDEYYSVKYGMKNAVSGEWKKGPGIELFQRAEEVLGKKNVIAEDLGFVTDSVRKLLKDSGYWGMKVLEFAFDARDTGASNDYLPHNYINDCVVYTGTHDNQTIASWFRDISEEERIKVRDYLCDRYTPDRKIHIPIIGLALMSPARICIIPIQDYLGYDDKARINQPSTLGKNWRWRLKKGDLSKELQKTIKNMTVQYGR